MFGGAVISLILPKLILSVIRDDILTFFYVVTLHAPQINDNKQARRVQQQAFYQNSILTDS
jgi:hypothetical protein